MKRKLTFKELEISDNADRSAQSARRGRKYIGFVYFIIHRKKIIYIGCTINPHIRETNHWTRLKKLGIEKYVIVFVGPFEWRLALKIESYEISSRASNKKLQNKQSKKQIYGKEFSIKNFGQKGVPYIRKGSEVKTMVGKYSY